MGLRLAMAVAVASLFSIEYLLGRSRGVETASVQDTSMNLMLAGGGLVVKAAWALLYLPVWSAAFDAAPWTFDFSLASMLVLVLLVDFAKYWIHRITHRTALLWAAHSVHHSSHHLNISTAIRESWPLVPTKFVLGIFCFLGFQPAQVLLATVVAAFYQIWIHTSQIDHLSSRFEYVFNSPAHHRVHHARNHNLLNKNFGSTLILWDRMFGTFASESEVVRYGVSATPPSANPFRVAFAGYVDLVRRRPRGGARSQAAWLLGPP